MKKRDNVFTNADKDSEFYLKEIVNKDGGFFRQGLIIITLDYILDFKVCVC